jgi:hypothetical protein
MSTQQRIDALKQSSEHWERRLQNLTEGRDELIAWQNEGVSVLNSSGENVLPSLIEEAEEAVQRVLKILTEMESLRDRALRGEKV